MKRQIARSVFWIVWSRGAVQVVSFLSTLLVARLLSPSDYGLIALASIWTNGVALLSELGLGAAIVQFQDTDDAELNACFWLTMALASVGYVFLYASAPTIASWFSSPKLGDILRVVGLTLPLTTVRIVPDSLLRKRLRLDRISQAEIVSTVVTISVVVSMAVAGAGVWALVAGALALPLVQSMMIFWFVWWWPGLEVSGRRVRAILRYSLANLGVKISWMIYQGGDDFILGKLSGNVILGFYSMAKQITAFPIDKVSTVVNQLAFPVMARLQSDPEAMRSTLLRGIRMVVWTTAPMSAGIILVGRDFVHTVLTDKWAPAVPILYPLALYGLIRSVAVLFPHVLMARYRARFLFGYNIVLVVALLPAFWVGVALGGPIGAALVWISVYPFIMVWMAHEALREVGLSWKALWSELWPTLTATLIMSAAVLAIQWVLSLQGGNMPAVRLAISVLVGATAFGLAFIRLGGATRREVLEIAGWMLHRGEALRAVE